MREEPSLIERTAEIRVGGGLGEELASAAEASDLEGVEGVEDEVHDIELSGIRTGEVEEGGENAEGEMRKSMDGSGRIMNRGVYVGPEAVPLRIVAREFSGSRREIEPERN